MADAPTLAQQLRNVRRWPWRSHYDFVAVKPIRLGKATIPPGAPAEIPPAEEGGAPRPLRRFHLMSLYRRRMVGAADDPWTRAQLLSYGLRLEAQQRNAEARASAEDAEQPPTNPALALLRAYGWMGGSTPPAPAAEPPTLQGSATLPGKFVSPAGVVQLGDLVRATVELLGVTADEWNALDEAAADDYLHQALDHLGWAPVEGS